MTRTRRITALPRTRTFAIVASLALSVGVAPPRPAAAAPAPRQVYGLFNLRDRVMAIANQSTADNTPVVTWPSGRRSRTVSGVGALPAARGDRIDWSPLAGHMTGVGECQ